MTAGRQSPIPMLRAVRRRALGIARALSDSRTAGRAVPAALLVYVLVWTLFATVSKAGINIQGDMAEAFALSRDLDIGYLKHPPVINWIVAGWFAIMPVAAWSYYLLAYVSAALAIWFTWLAAGFVTDGRRRLLAVLLLCLVPLFTFHAATYNHNTVQLPLWPLATLAFLVSIERRHLVWSVLFGLACALAVLAKYYAGAILIGLLLASLVHPERAAYWRSPRPYVAMLAFLVAVAPHFYGVATADFVALRSPVESFTVSSPLALLMQSSRYLGAYVAYLAGVLLLVALLPRQPFRTRVATTFGDWPPMRRVVGLIALAPLLLPLLLLPLVCVAARVPWMYPAFFFAPLLLVLAPRLVVSLRMVAITLALVVALFAGVLLAAPVVAVTTFLTAKSERIEPFPALAAVAMETWRERTATPLAYVGGSVVPSRYISFYSPDHPAPLPGAGQVMSAEETAAEWGRRGVLGLCRQDETDCNRLFADAFPQAERMPLTLPRGFFRMRRGNFHYVIYVVRPGTTPNRTRLVLTQ